MAFFMFYSYQTKQVRGTSEAEETGDEVIVKEELFNDDSDEEKLVEDGPVFDADRHPKKEKAK